MNPLSTPGSVIAVRRGQQRRLAEWMAEWRIEMALCHADTSAADDRGSHGGVGESIPDAGPAPVRGQIRLLYPDTEAAWSRPLYGAVLGPLEQGTWLTVPFGRLSTPAISGEWRTGLRPLPLRVICAWNARRTPAARLVRSWHAGDLRVAVLETVEQLVAWLFGGMPAANLSARILGGLGAPLLHPADPRWSYLAQTAESGDAWGNRWRVPCEGAYRLGADLAAGKGNGYAFPAANERLLAAEPRGRYLADPESD